VAEDNGSRESRRDSGVVRAMAELLSPKQLATIIVVGFGFLTWFVYEVVYVGMKEQIKELQERVQKVDDRFGNAFAAGVRVEDLLKRSPQLEQQIADTNKQINEVSKIVVHLQTLMDGPPSIPQQIQTVQQGVTQIEKQTDNIQSQIRQSPGAPR
jgi:hypothetical protein